MKSAKANKFEAMALAKLGDARAWVRLLYHTNNYVVQSMATTKKRLITAEKFSWETVAKETLKVFNITA